MPPSWSGSRSTSAIFRYAYVCRPGQTAISLPGHAFAARAGLSSALTRAGPAATLAPLPPLPPVAHPGRQLLINSL
ncbi:hypothetical protein FHR83_001806 [Actinoplanes campanulatus]|uniref:Uncharacterized protein n=1 Tax=Actinoplanes campanulatus TaxID=113559 RepID=A0A7W5AE64_9ACTN|nr:hypothetical protein [Actinoplanes campanulatus]GGN43385.1 hypothetical protein GCM10010109_75470 [Actinoplanes campanulatus]GID42331.1 hypothetical protein Aca09nite_88370 [Actinoplanes campanulatus]